MGSGNPLEVQHFGYQLLQSLVWMPCRAAITLSMQTPSQNNNPGSRSCRLSMVHGQVTSRWERFTAEEHAQLAGLAFSLFQQGALRCAFPHASSKPYSHAHAAI